VDVSIVVGPIEKYKARVVAKVLQKPERSADVIFKTSIAKEKNEYNAATLLLIIVGN